MKIVESRKLRKKCRRLALKFTNNWWEADALESRIFSLVERELNLMKSEGVAKLSRTGSGEAP